MADENAIAGGGGGEGVFCNLILLAAAVLDLAPRFGVDERDEERDDELLLRLLLSLRDNDFRWRRSRS